MTPEAAPTTSAPKPDAHPLQAWKPRSTPFNWMMGSTLVVFGIADPILAKVVHLTGLSSLLNIWPTFLILTFSLGYCIQRPLPKLIDGCKLAILILLEMMVLVPLILIAARSPFPLVDQQLAAIDFQMHFSTVKIVAFVARFSFLQIPLALSYMFLPFFAGAAIIVPLIFGQLDVVRRFIASVVVCLVLTAAIFTFLPAVGPWRTEGFNPVQEQRNVAPALLELKSDRPVDYSKQDAALVCFPSFHVALALLSGFALGSVRRFRLGAWILASLICISTITTGWHYGIDGLGGAALAALCIGMTSRIAKD